MLIMLFGVQHNYAIGEELQFATEVGNVKDGYAISVLQGSDVLGHLRTSRFCTSGSWNILQHILIMSHRFNYYERTQPQK